MQLTDSTAVLAAVTRTTDTLVAVTLPWGVWWIVALFALHGMMRSGIDVYGFTAALWDRARVRLWH